MLGQLEKLLIAVMPRVAACIMGWCRQITVLIARTPVRLAFQLLAMTGCTLHRVYFRSATDYLKVIRRQISGRGSVVDKRVSDSDAREGDETQTCCKLAGTGHAVAPTSTIPKRETLVQVPPNGRSRPAVRAVRALCWVRAAAEQTSDRHFRGEQLSAFIRDRSDSE